MPQKDKRYFIVGSGGREHAIALKLLADEQCNKVYVAPGNPGMKLSDPERVKLVDIQPSNVDLLLQWCKVNKPDLVIVGPEDPLNRGLVDLLTQSGIKAFGPTKLAAEIECNKQYAKDFMSRNGIKTAKYGSFFNSKIACQFIDTEAGFENGYVIKASGLASGKGVVIAFTQEEAKKTVISFIDEKLFGSASEVVIIEEFIVGEECSAMAFCDGNSVSLMPTAQDNKKAYDNDQGPMTGGMGAVCPFDLVESNVELKRKIEIEVIQRCIDGLSRENRKFVGVLFAGVMISSNNQDVYVLEYNCRFGDPETQSVLPLLQLPEQCSFGDLLEACVDGQLSKVSLNWRADIKTCGVVIADLGYPISTKKGQPIHNLPPATTATQYSNLKHGSTLIIHAGTKFAGEANQQTLATNGGRILTVVGVGDSVSKAQLAATEQASQVGIESSRFRSDIGSRIIKRERAATGGLTYKDSGVDIDKGEEFVDYVKRIVKATNTAGTMPSIGAFAAMFDLKKTNLVDPILVSGTDGVGTKLTLALQMKNLLTIGQDLVAMCVNDVLVHGAKPLFFLDYYACCSINLGIAKQVLAGIVDGCKLADCSLIGGETAELSSTYTGDNIDLAGFAVGAVERSELLPKSKAMKPGDIVIGLPSSGVHSNGFSLVRQFLALNKLSLDDKCPFKFNGRDKYCSTIGECLLTPTKIYVAQVSKALESNRTAIKAMAHITGGGLVDNVSRSIPDGLCAELEATLWSVPPVFGWIWRDGPVSDEEMLRVFNLGIGMALVVDSSKVEATLASLRSDFGGDSEAAFKIGTIVAASATDEDAKNTKCVVYNLSPAMHISATNVGSIERVTSSFGFRKKRAAILLSGTGTNARSLIDNSLLKATSCPYEVSLVVASNNSALGVKYPQERNIKTRVINRKSFENRALFESELDACLRAEQIELVALAGFMLILSDEFVVRWSGRVLNVHPSLLPSFKGMHAYKQALDAGVRITGCTVHFVSAGVDEGAIIAQRAVEVLPSDDERSLQERGKLVEHQLFAHALELVASGQVTYDASKNVSVWQTAAAK